MTDRWVIRAVVIIIGLITLTGLVGGIVLAYQEKSVGDFIVATVAGGLGALGALLAKTGLDAITELRAAAALPIPDPPAPAPVVEG